MVLKIVAPVVENPLIVSKYASTNMAQVPEMYKGKDPKKATRIQERVTMQKPSRSPNDSKFFLPSLKQNLNQSPLIRDKMIEQKKEKGVPLVENIGKGE